MLRGFISIILATSLIMSFEETTRSGVFAVSFSQPAQYCRQIRWKLRSLGEVKA